MKTILGYSHRYVKIIMNKNIGATGIFIQIKAYISVNLPFFTYFAQGGYGHSKKFLKKLRVVECFFLNVST